MVIGHTTKPMGTERQISEWIEGLDDRERDEFRDRLRETNRRRGEAKPESADFLRELTEMAEHGEPLGELYLDTYIEHSRDSGVVSALKLEVVEAVAQGRREDPFAFDGPEGGERLDVLVSEVTARFHEGLIVAPGDGQPVGGAKVAKFMTEGTELPDFHERLEQAIADQPPDTEWIGSMRERLQEFSLHVFGNKLALETAVEVAQYRLGETFSDSEVAHAIDQPGRQERSTARPQARGILLRLEEAGLVVRAEDEPGTSDPRSVYYRRTAHPYWDAVTEIGRYESALFHGTRLNRE